MSLRVAANDAKTYSVLISREISGGFSSFGCVLRYYENNIRNWEENKRKLLECCLCCFK